jgi:hypothetical protein
MNIPSAFLFAFIATLATMIHQTHAQGRLRHNTRGRSSAAASGRAQVVRPKPVTQTNKKPVRVAGLPKTRSNDSHGTRATGKNSLGVSGGSVQKKTSTLKPVKVLTPKTQRAGGGGSDGKPPPKKKAGPNASGSKGSDPHVPGYIRPRKGKKLDGEGAQPANKMSTGENPVSSSSTGGSITSKWTQDDASSKSTDSSVKK